MIVGNTLNVVAVLPFVVDDVLHIFGSTIHFVDLILQGGVSDDSKAVVVVVAFVSDDSKAAVVAFVSDNSKAAAVVLVSDNSMMFAVRVAVVHSLEE